MPEPVLPRTKGGHGRSVAGGPPTPHPGRAPTRLAAGGRTTGTRYAALGTKRPSCTGSASSTRTNAAPAPTMSSAAIAAGNPVARPDGGCSWARSTISGDDDDDGVGVGGGIPTITGGLPWPDWFGAGVRPGVVGGACVGETVATTGPLLVGVADGGAELADGCGEAD